PGAARPRRSPARGGPDRRLFLRGRLRGALGDGLRLRGVGGGLGVVGLGLVFVVGDDVCLDTGDGRGTGFDGAADLITGGLFGQPHGVQRGTGVAGTDPVLALLLVIGVQRAAQRAQAVHADEAARLGDDGLVFAAPIAARLAGED